MPSEPLLEVSNLRVEFPQRRSVFTAVSDVSFTIAPGETVGLVGESGSGKTTISRAILGLVQPTAGQVVFDGQDLTGCSHPERRRISGDIRAVFQDPYSSLNPALRASVSLTEGLDHLGIGQAEAEARMRELLARVGLPPTAATSYPRTLSGGQRQRLAIGRALMSSPRVLICDEPVSALDVSVQAQVLNLLREVQQSSSLSCLFIGHDLDVVRFMSDRIIVLYRGRIVEEGPADMVARQPRHPYTQALMAATPKIDKRTRQPGDTPAFAPGRRGAAGAGGEGCAFADRCPQVIDRCLTERPLLEVVEGRSVACHRCEPDQSTPVTPPENHRRDKTTRPDRS